MALSPLADLPQKANGTPTEGGLNTRDASNYIAELIDDEGRTANDVGRGGVSNRDASEGRAPENIAADEDKITDQPNNDLKSQDLDDDSDKPPEGGADGDLEPDSNSGDELQADNSEQDADPINTLTELAEALEMPIDELKGHMTHTFKAAGEERTVTLAELEKGYQLQTDYDRSKGKLAEQRQALESEHQNRLKTFNDNSIALAETMRIAEQSIITDQNSPEMQRLRDNDPGLWVAKQRENDQKLAQLQQARQGASEQYSAVMQDNRNQFLAREGEKLASTVDGWGEDKLRIAVDTVKTLGFDDNEVVGIVDSRLIKAALELKELRELRTQYETQMSKADETVNKVKKTVPKTLSAGKLTRSKVNANGVNTANVNKIKKRFNKSNSVKDAADLIANLNII